MPEFWCGVLATAAVEIAALIIAAIMYDKKKPKKGK